MNRRKLFGGIVAFIGFILSPLSWWNDLLVNIPLAYGFASLFNMINHNLFLPSFVIGYWLTNILGLLLAHRGIEEIISKNPKNHFKRDLTISLLYTIAISILIVTGVLKPPQLNF